MEVVGLNTVIYCAEIGHQAVAAPSVAIAATQRLIAVLDVKAAHVTRRRRSVQARLPRQLLPGL